ncbi:MAG: hemerythrin domain-containing protein, partial [Candidatus Methylomirabilota bacterium]
MRPKPSSLGWSRWRAENGSSIPACPWTSPLFAAHRLTPKETSLWSTSQPPWESTQCHHGKEENLLFKTMVDRGFPRQGGPIAVMLHEHETGRSF